AAQPLVRALAAHYPTTRILMTCMTPTGRESAAEVFSKELGDRCMQAYLPYDYGGAPGRFLRAWRPAIGLLMETELWPNLMAAAEAEAVPMALINARLSPRSLRRGLRQRSLIRPAARRLSLVLAQSPGDAERIAQFGRTVDAVTGNLKFDNAPNAALMARGHAWRRLIGRPVLLAASTREGEEALIWQAWRAQGQGQGQWGETSSPSASRVASHSASEAASTALSTGSARHPLLLIVPRHPQRFEAVTRAAQAAGLVVARRADLDDPRFDASSIDLLIGDSMGEMDAWYALADCAIIGGSLLPFGSQNLIEACAAGCPVVIGPSTFNFAQAAAQALEAGAAQSVTDADDAIATGLSILADASRKQAMAEAGTDFASRHRGATERTVAALTPLMAASLPDQ
ncbi:MAG: 3-deoxy-D-manno-octulosonic acid transferase, partial [Burkholderiales bacterium]|nr:3-deoxy-D-manno-octulosonic acid transferase [Burkholderiales bacterium]